MLIRTFAGACAIALALAGAGCGGDDEDVAGTSSPTGPEATVPTIGPTGPDTEEEPTAEAQPDDGAASPEDQEGGAGDEEPARTEVVLEFSERGFTPSEVAVAPFFPVVLVIRSDGTEYDLSYTAPSSGGGANGTTEADFEIDGLRPGQEIEVEERNTDSRATIEASEEAGP